MEANVELLGDFGSCVAMWWAELTVACSVGSVVWRVWVVSGGDGEGAGPKGAGRRGYGVGGSVGVLNRKSALTG